MKKKIVILGIIVTAVVLLVLGIFCATRNANDEAGDVNTHETFKKIYESDDNVWYYSNDQEKIYKLSGYRDLDKYFYNNVASGSTEDYKYFLIDINGKYIIEPGEYKYISRTTKNIHGEFNYLNIGSTDYYNITLDSGKGIVDYKGNVIIKPEYSRIKYYESDSAGYFLVEKSSNDEYYLLNEKGEEILKNNTEISDDDIEVCEGLTSKCPPTVLYKGTLYNLENGKTLLTGLEGGSYSQNLFYNNQTLTIYDESFKVKKEIKDFDWNDDKEKGKDGHWILTIDEKEYYLNDKFNLVEIEKETEEEFAKKEGFKQIEGANYHVFANGKKYITKVDNSSKAIIIYNKSGEKVNTVPVGNPNSVKKIYSIGNYLVVRYGRHNYLNLLDVTTGKFIVENINNLILDYYEESKIIRAGKIGGGTVFLNENFKLELDKYSYYEIGDDYIWVYNTNTYTAKCYDLNGKVKNEITGIEKEVDLADGYFMYVASEGKSKILSKESGKIVFEFVLPSNDIYSGGYYVPHDDDGIGIIELADGLYTLDGKKLMEKD